MEASPGKHTLEQEKEKKRWSDGARTASRPRNGWTPVEARASLEPGEVHVFRARLDTAPSGLRNLRRVLSPEELEQHREDEEGPLRLAALATLRRLLSRYLDADPADLPPLREGDGRPAPERSASGLRFHHARSGRLAVFAFSGSTPVGIDVQRIRRLEDLEGREDPFAAESFSVVERETLRGLPPGLRAQGFFQCRTRKRALLEAADGDLPCALRDFDVTVTPGVPPRIYRWRKTDGSPRDWTLLHLRPGPRHVGAVAVPGRVSGLRLWSWPGEGDDAG